jgi:formiminotetrahydrofolate cyclodeaminase
VTAVSPSLSDLSLAAITEAVDSDAPVPGGGAVAACTGALASALAGMASQAHAAAAEAAAIAKHCAALVSETPERRTG